MAAVLDQLNAVKAADDTVEKKRKQFGTIALITGIAGVPLLMFVTPLGCLSFLVFIPCLVLYIKNVQRDLDDERLEMARDLLTSLRPDLSEKSPVEVVIRHGDMFRFGTTANQRSEGNWMSGRVNYSDHEDTWLSFRGRMADGSTLKLEVSTSAKRKSKPKRKYTKINDRMRDEVEVVLRVPEGQYPHLERLEGALRPDLLQQNGQMTASGLSLQPGLVRLSATPGMRTGFSGRGGRSENGPKIQVRHMVSVLAFLYGGLGACRGETPVRKG